MAATVTLAYDCDLGIQNIAAGSPAYLAVSTFDVDPNNDVADRLGLSKIGDSTSEVAGQLRRELIYDVLAAANEQFPTDALLKAATIKLFSGVLSSGIPCRVTPLDPVIA